MIPNCPGDALSFIQECLRWDPTKRISAAQMVNHPYLNKEKPQEIGMKKISSLGGEKVNYKLEV